jgi:hypothetical protein
MCHAARSGFRAACGLPGGNIMQEALDMLSRDCWDLETA